MLTAAFNTPAATRKTDHDDSYNVSSGGSSSSLSISDKNDKESLSKRYHSAGSICINPPIHNQQLLSEQSDTFIQSDVSNVDRYEKISKHEPTRGRTVSTSNQQSIAGKRLLSMSTASPSNAELSLVTNTNKLPFVRPVSAQPSQTLIMLQKQKQSKKSVSDEANENDLKKQVNDIDSATALTCKEEAIEHEHDKFKVSSLGDHREASRIYQSKTPKLDSSMHKSLPVSFFSST